MGNWGAGWEGSVGLGPPVDRAWRGRTAPLPPVTKLLPRTRPGGLGACGFLPGCAGDSRTCGRGRAHAPAHTHMHVHTYTRTHVTRACTHMCAPSRRELTLRRPRQHPRGSRTPGAASPSAPALPQPRLPGEEGALVPRWPPAPKHARCPAGQSHTGSSAGAAPALGTSGVDAGRAAQHFPAGLRLGAGGWGLAASLSALNRPLGHGPGPQAEHTGSDAASTWSGASLVQPPGGEAGHVPPGTLCPAPPGPAAQLSASDHRACAHCTEG